MPPLTLNKELCKFAEDWAENLASSCQIEHRPLNSYGENLYCKLGRVSKKQSAAASLGREAVESWYNTKMFYDFKSPGLNAGHFTQVVWKGSRELGVGMAKGHDALYVVANYNPPGNNQNSSVRGFELNVFQD